MTNQVNMPWEIKTYVKGLSIVYGSHGKPMRVKADSDEILEHIVRCVNSHDALVDALNEAIRLRVALYRNGDAEDDYKHLTDTQVAMKDTYAAKWTAALTAAGVKP